MNKQMTKIALMVVLAIGLTASAAMAQNEIGARPMKGLIYDGVETSAGSQDPVSGFQYGNTFVLASEGKAESRYMTVSVNSRAMFKGVGVTGGAWSIAVFRDGVYVGSVYGEVISGEIQEIVNKKGVLIGKRTRIDLLGTGGTGIFDYDKAPNISGSLNMTTELITEKKNTTAFETLNF